MLTRFIDNLDTYYRFSNSMLESDSSSITTSLCIFYSGSKCFKTNSAIECYCIQSLPCSWMSISKLLAKRISIERDPIWRHLESHLWKFHYSNQILWRAPITGRHPARRWRNLSNDAKNSVSFSNDITFA